MKTTPTLLAQGDVIKLVQGMNVYAKIQERFCYSNRMFSTDTTQTNVEIGKTYKTVILDKHKNAIVEEIQTLLKDQGIAVQKKKIVDFISEEIKHYPQTASWKLDGGEFLVIKTEMTGGGSGNRPGDEYPDGHLVTAKRLTPDGKFDPNGEVVTFYQTGAFTATISPEQIAPIRKMSLNFE